MIKPVDLEKIGYEETYEFINSKTKSYQQFAFEYFSKEEWTKKEKRNMKQIL